jgi:biotin transport system permease protein/energy-coupling factor transport system permease protein
MFNLGFYIPGNSPIHRLDPRVKMLSVLILSVLIFGSGPVSVLPVSLVLGWLICAAGISPAQALKSLRPVALFFLCIFLLHAFFTPGRPVVEIPGFTISREGLATGSLLTWKFVCLIVSAMVLTATTLPSDLVSGIERLLRPLKFAGINSHDAAMMISLALRFVPSLIGEYQRIRTAQAARGMDLGKGGLRGKIRGITCLALPLTVNSFLRAEEIAAAMESRGYARGDRTYLRELCLRKADYGAMALVLAFSICLQVLA